LEEEIVELSFPLLFPPFVVFWRLHSTPGRELNKFRIRSLRSLPTTLWKIFSSEGGPSFEE